MVTCSHDVVVALARFDQEHEKEERRSRAGAKALWGDPERTATGVATHSSQCSRRGGSASMDSSIADELISRVEGTRICRR